MDESNDKMGLLMFIDDIGLLLSTFGVLLVFYLIQGSSVISTNVWIICLFFTGIKILLTGIADITGIARKLWVSVLFIVIADAVIILVNRFMSFGLSNMMLLITMLVDIVVIVLCLLIWKKIVGRDVLEEDARRSAWVKDESREKPEQINSAGLQAAQPFSTDEFESLFEREEEKEASQEVPGQEQGGQALPDGKEELFGTEDDFYATFGGILGEEDAKPHEAAGRHAFENVEQFDVIHFDDEDFSAPETKTEPGMEQEELQAEVDPDLIAPAQDAPAEAGEIPAVPLPEDGIEETVPAGSGQGPDLSGQDDFFDAMIFAEEPDHPDESAAMPEEAPAEAEQVQAQGETEEAQVSADTESVPENGGQEAITDEDIAAARQEAAKIPKEVTEQIEDEICRELDTIYNRMKASSEKSEVLSRNVENFSREVDEMPAITSAEDIVKSGRLIRSKLRTIIDKQFVMDDVLNEVIETSEKINQRVARLNQIEAQLRERENRLNEQEYRLREKTEEISLFEDFTSPIQKVDTEGSVERYQTIGAAPEEELPAAGAGEAPKTEAKAGKKLVRPGEVLLENDEFRILIREEDLDLVRAYLSEHEI